MNKKIKLFTHTDLDGVGGAIVANTVYGEDNVDVEYCDYSNINERVMEFIEDKKYSEYDFVYITDISITLDNAQIIDDIVIECDEEETKLSEKIRLLDHHNTAVGLNKFYWCKVGEYNNDIIKDYKTSGTFMLYEYLKDKEHFEDKDKVIYEYANFVREYDTWIWTENNNLQAKQLNDLFYIYGIKVFNKIFTKRLKDHLTNIKQFELLSETDLILLKVEQARVYEYINNKADQLIKKNILGYNAGVVFAERNTSELGLELNKRNKELDFVVIINLNDNKVSYRTAKDNIDLGGEIAKYFGGGGHPKSAGSVLDNEIIHQMIDIIIRGKSK